MNERTKDVLHRWLPKLAVLSLLACFSFFLLAEYYVRPRFDAAAKEYRDKRVHRLQEYEQAREEKAGEAKVALERIVGLIDTLDGNQKTQQALSEAVAQEKAIGEVWVTNAQGLIVYYGRHDPPVRNVADFPLGSLTETLNVIPEDVLSPIQRTAILLPAVIGGYRYGLPYPPSSSRADITPKHLIISTEPRLHIDAGRPVAMTRVKDGLIAVTPPRLLYSSPSSDARREGILLWLNTITLAALVGLILFWLSIPAWMALDAEKRRERAAAWGFLGLLGNMIALVVYWLVREDGPPAENS